MLFTVVPGLGCFDYSAERISCFLWPSSVEKCPNVLGITNGVTSPRPLKTDKTVGDSLSQSTRRAAVRRNSVPLNGTVNLRVSRQKTHGWLSRDCFTNPVQKFPSNLKGARRWQSSIYSA